MQHGLDHVMPVFAAIALMVAIAPLHAAERYGDHAPARLSIENRVADAVVRCQVVLAHFVTLADYRLAPGSTRELVLQRDRSSGALVVPRDDGRPMAIESLYCGLDERWDETRAAVDLTGLREPDREHFSLVCDGLRPPVCRDDD